MWRVLSSTSVRVWEVDKELKKTKNCPPTSCMMRGTITKYGAGSLLHRPMFSDLIARLADPLKLWEDSAAIWRSDTLCRALVKFSLQLQVRQTLLGRGVKHSFLTSALVGG